MMKSVSGKKILWGVCGIGNGHTFRQLPLIEHFAQANRIVIFAYGESYKFYQNHFKDTPFVTIEAVAVPFYVGNKDGLDFEATANHPANQGVDYTAINTAAMAKAQSQIGKPDLVVSDYEPVCAQYAYASNAPLVTIDQQSKYLAGAFPNDLGGVGYKDEIDRLMMFFPKAHTRIACSFFDVARLDAPVADVQIVAPTLNPVITKLERTPDVNGKTFLVYLSSQQPFGQSLGEVTAVCNDLADCKFHVFLKGVQSGTYGNVIVHDHGDGKFHDILAQCNGIVSTAGHSLFSEAMHLGIPVYAIPLPVYEQQMNAHVIAENGFGASHKTLNVGALQDFTQNVPFYCQNILNDKTVLLGRKDKSVQVDIIRTLEALVL